MMSTRLRFVFLASLLAIATMLLAIGCGEDRPDSPTLTEDAPKTDAATATDVVPSIRNFAQTTFGDLVATATTTRSGIQAVLKDARDNELARLDWNQADGIIRLSSPRVTPISGPDDGKQLKVSGSTYAVYYYWRNVQAALADAGKLPGNVEVLPAAPGCDYFPDALETKCISDCCDAHDACWAANDCDGWSWIGAGSLQCIWCNVKVVACIAACVVEAIIDVIGEIFPH